MFSGLMWIAMLASGAAAGWAVCDARRSWRTRQLSSHSRWRLRYTLDLARFAVAFLFALDLLLAALVSHHSESDLRPLVIVAGSVAAILYTVLLLLPMALRSRRTGH